MAGLSQLNFSWLFPVFLECVRRCCMCLFPRWMKNRRKKVKKKKLTIATEIYKTIFFKNLWNLEVLIFVNFSRVLNPVPTKRVDAQPLRTNNLHDKADASAVHVEHAPRSCQTSFILPPTSHRRFWRLIRKWKQGRERNIMEGVSWELLGKRQETRHA